MSDDDFLDELQDAAIAASSIVGVNQRSQQINELQQVKVLLQAQANERQRQANLPKCPECRNPVEINASLCAQCRSGIEWIKLSDGLRLLSKAKLKDELAALQASYLSQCTAAQKNWKQTLTALRDAINDVKPPLDRLNTRFAELDTVVPFDDAKNKEDDSSPEGCGIHMALFFLLGFPLCLATKGIYLLTTMGVEGPLMPFFMLAAWIAPNIILAVLMNADAKPAKPVNDPRKVDELKQALEADLLPPFRRILPRMAAIHNSIQLCIDSNTVIQHLEYNNLQNTIPAKTLHFLTTVSTCPPFTLPETYLKQLKHISLHGLANRLSMIDRWADGLFEKFSISCPSTKTKPPVGTPKVSGITPAKQDFPIEEAPAAMPSAPTQLNNYFWIKRGGKTKGPISLATMLKHLSQKQIKVSDKIRESEDGPWETAAVAAKRIKAMANKG